jgi:hypothetical protein
LPGGELIDRLQNIAGNVADRQYLNSRPLRQWSDGSDALTSSCPKINLSPRSPAISAGSVVIDLFIYIYLFLFVWVVVAGGPQLRAPEEILFGFLGASLTSFSGNGRSKFRKILKKSGTQTFQCVRLQSSTPLG